MEPVSLCQLIAVNPCIAHLQSMLTKGTISGVEHTSTRQGLDSTTGDLTARLLPLPVVATCTDDSSSARSFLRKVISAHAEMTFHVDMFSVQGPLHHMIVHRWPKSVVAGQRYPGSCFVNNRTLTVPVLSYTQTYVIGATVNHGGSRADIVPSTDRQGVRKVETMNKLPAFPHPDRRFGYDHLTAKMKPVPQSTLMQSMGPSYQTKQCEIDDELLARFVRSGPLYIMPANVERQTPMTPWR